MMTYVGYENIQHELMAKPFVQLKIVRLKCKWLIWHKLNKKKITRFYCVNEYARFLSTAVV